MANNRLVYMNGEFLPESEAKVSIYDSDSGKNSPFIYTNRLLAIFLSFY
jgi:hypothetical protein